MELEYAIFAKAADLSPDGIFSLIGGGFDGIAVSKFPAMTPPVALLAHLRLKPEEVGRTYRLRIDVVAPDGRLLPAGDESAVTPERPSPDPRRPPGYTIVLQVYGVELPVPGEYQFRLFVDGRPLGTVSLFVEQAGL